MKMNTGNVPIQYGVNILEWNPGGEKSLKKMRGNRISAKTYSYQADAIICSSNEKKIPLLFCLWWVNKRFGKKSRK
jgi:hypothetical protein